MHYQELPEDLDHFKFSVLEHCQQQLVFIVSASSNNNKKLYFNSVTLFQELECNSSAVIFLIPEGKNSREKKLLFPCAETEEKISKYFNCQVAVCHSFWSKLAPCISSTICIWKFYRC